MNGYFTKPGKYGAGPKTSVVVTEEDVKGKKYFDISSDYSNYFIQAGAFVAGIPESPKADDFSPKQSKKKQVNKPQE